MKYFETNSTDPCLNLALEEYILCHKTGDDWLMLWQNANTVVVGLNQNAAQEIDRGFVERHGIQVVRRSTGGGAVYHDLGNLNYSFISDLGRAEELSIARFSAPVCRALIKMGVPAQLSGRNDITVEGKKISGVAQRVYKDRILHHGTLLFHSDLAMVSGALRADPEKFSSKSVKSVSSRVANIKDYLPEEMSLRDFWDRLREELGREGAMRAELLPSELAEAERLAEEKYRSWDWNYGRSPKYGFSNRRRFPGGTLAVELEVQEGVIKKAAFMGDFMARIPNTPAAAALEGLRLRRREVAAALALEDIPSMFGGISLEEILETMGL